jgi:hypothetical protein
MATLEIKNRVRENGKKRTEKDKERERHLQHTRDFAFFIVHTPLPPNLAGATQRTPRIKSTNQPHLVKRVAAVNAAAVTAATTMTFNTLIAHLS